MRFSHAGAQLLLACVGGVCVSRPVISWPREKLITEFPSVPRIPVLTAETSLNWEGLSGFQYSNKPAASVPGSIATAIALAVGISASQSIIVSLYQGAITAYSEVPLKDSGPDATVSTQFCRIVKPDPIDTWAHS